MYDRIRKSPIAYRNFKKRVADLTLAREMDKLRRQEIQSGNPNKAMECPDDEPTEFRAPHTALLAGELAVGLRFRV